MRIAKKALPRSTMKFKETDATKMILHEGYTARVQGMAEELEGFGEYVSYEVRVFYNNQIIGSTTHPIGSTTHPNTKEKIEKFIRFAIEQHKAKKAGIREYIVEEGEK